MAKPEWGVKRTCFSCGARFYDLRREPIICPICSTVYDPARQPRPRRSGAGARDEAPISPALAGGEAAGRSLDGDLLTEEGGESEAEDLEEGGEDGDDIDDLSSEDSEIIEDASELGEDDDDIGEVMEHVDDELEDKA